MTQRAVLLDLDGTLMHTLPDLDLAANQFLQEHDLPPLPDGKLADFVGKGSRDMMTRLLAHVAHEATPARPMPDLDSAVEQFFEHYHAVNGQHSTVYPGVVAGLQHWQQTGVRLAVVTNKSMAFAQPLLEQSGLAPYFDVVVAGDTCSHKKPHPLPLQYACEQLGVAPVNAVMVGDSVNDARAAKAAGMPVLLVPYGYNQGVDINTLKPTAIVNSVYEAATGVYWPA